MKMGSLLLRNFGTVYQTERRHNAENHNIDKEFLIKSDWGQRTAGA
jgi:hypothetical protein